MKINGIVPQMSVKRWRLVVTAPDSAQPLHTLDVNADNWITALRLGREMMGEDGGLPPGASCDVSQPGKVTVLDPNTQRIYSLDSLEEGVHPPTTTTGSPEQSARPSIGAARSRTLAYEQPQTPSPASKISQRPLDLAPRSLSVSAPRQRSHHPPKTDRPGGWMLLCQRDIDPTVDSPLLYRERGYAVSPGTETSAAEQQLKNAFEMLRASLATKPRGKYLNLAVFDHVWKAQPERPPLVTLQWKDWLIEPTIGYGGLVAAKPSTPPPAPPAPSAPPPPPEPSIRNRSQPPASPFRSAGPATGEHDMRLASMFEDMQDLQLLKTPAEGLHFATQLLKKSIACEAIGAYLYDIDENKFRLVAAEGEYAEKHTGEAVSTDTGLFQAASLQVDEALSIDPVASDPRYAASSDAHLHPNPRNMLLMSLNYDNVLLGVLQLVNRKDAPTFDDNDRNVVAYVGRQLSTFIHFARIRLLSVP